MQNVLVRVFAGLVDLGRDILNAYRNFVLATSMTGWEAGLSNFVGINVVPYFKRIFACNFILIPNYFILSMSYHGLMCSRMGIAIYVKFGFDTTFKKLLTAIPIVELFVPESFKCWNPTG